MLPFLITGVVFFGVSFITYCTLMRLHGSTVLRQRLAGFSQAAVTAVDCDEVSEQAKKSLGKNILESISGALGLKQSRRLETKLARAAIALKPSEFVVLSGLLALMPLGLVLLGYSLVSSFALAMLGVVLPQFYLRMRQVKRTKKLSAQIPECLVMIANALKAGYSFLQSMELVARETEDPIAQEFTKVLKEMNLGVTTEHALEAMVVRVGSDDLDIVITAVLIQRQIGGNLSQILDSISETIRERIKIKGEIQTLTAQGRVSGIVISGLPICIGCFIYIINPDYLSVLFTETLGQLFLALGFVGQVIAALLIRKIVSIQV